MCKKGEHVLKIRDEIYDGYKTYSEQNTTIKIAQVVNDSV